MANAQSSRSKVITRQLKLKGSKLNSYARQAQLKLMDKALELMLDRHSSK